MKKNYFGCAPSAKKSLFNYYPALILRKRCLLLFLLFALKSSSGRDIYHFIHILNKSQSNILKSVFMYKNLLKMTSQYFDILMQAWVNTL